MQSAQVASSNKPTAATTISTTSAPSGGGGIDLTGASYEQSRRQVSSVIVSEELLGDVPQSGGVRYVEVPVVENVVRHVPKREVVEVEKIVPRYEVEWIEQEVSVPQVVYVDKPVERTQIQEVVRTIPKKTVHEIPREVVRTVPKVEYVQVPRTVNVGQVVEVPKPVLVERPVHIKNWQVKQIPVVVAQTIRPVVSESPEVIDVDVYEYEPEVIPVDIHVAKPVSAQLVAVGATDEVHQQISIPLAQYNTILRQLNSHLTAEDQQQLPYYVDESDKSVPFLTPRETPGFAAMAPSARFDEPADIKGRGLLTTTGALEPFRPGTAAAISARGAPMHGMTTTSSTQQHQQPTTPVYPPHSMMTTTKTIDPMKIQRVERLHGECCELFNGNPDMLARMDRLMNKYVNEPDQQLQLLQQFHDIGMKQRSRGIGADSSQQQHEHLSRLSHGVQHKAQAVPPVYPTVRNRELTDENRGTGDHTQQAEATNRMLNHAQQLIQQANARITQQQSQQQLSQPSQSQMMPMNTSRGVQSRAGSDRRYQQSGVEGLSQQRSSRTGQKRRPGCQC